MRRTSNPHTRFTVPSLLSLLAVIVSLVGLLGLSPTAHAQFNVPSDGSDGAFNPTANITIDLGTAKTATWDTPADYNLQGVYDPEQWIVVYKFTSVNIPSNVTVTFKNHPKNPPVVWLVQGDVTINGTVNLDGKAGSPVFGEGGPGGFRGGASTPFARPRGWDAAGSAPMVGNAGCFPLIGGSGGDADGFWSSPGGGGGGAILIASATRISGGGGVRAHGWRPGANGAQASGGMIRLVSPEISLGSCSAIGARVGRIRVEADSATITVSNPNYSSAPLPSDFVFLRHALTPAIRVLSLGGVTAPSDPTGRFASPTEVVVPNSAVEILLECRNVPLNAVVQVELRSAANANVSTVNATFLSGNLEQSTWIANGNLGTSLGYATVMARAVLPNP